MQVFQKKLTKYREEAEAI